MADNKYNWEKDLLKQREFDVPEQHNNGWTTNTVQLPQPGTWTLFPQQLGVVSVKNIAKALLVAQRNIGAAVKDAKNPFFKSNYATLGSVMEACKDALNNAGIVVTQPVVSDNTGEYVETQLLHAESGEMLTSRMRLLTPKNMQDYGSAISYARRYSLQSLMFIPAEDDDGSAASATVKAPPVKQEVKPVSSFKKATVLEQLPVPPAAPEVKSEGEEW